MSKTPKEIHFTIQCTEGHVAEFLRELASVIENSESDDYSCIEDYETSVGVVYNLVEEEMPE